MTPRGPADELVAPHVWARALDPSLGSPAPGCVVAVDAEGRGHRGLAAAAAWHAGDSLAVTAATAWGLRAIEDLLARWAAGLLVVGRSLLRTWRVPPGLPVLAYGSAQTPGATAGMRALLAAGRLAHDGSPALTLAVAASRVPAGYGGIARDASPAPVTAAKAAAWALAAAARTTPV